MNERPTTPDLDQYDSQVFPDRPFDYLDAFGTTLSMSARDRENQIVKLACAGVVPDHLRCFKQIEVRTKDASAKLLVLPDYLGIGQGDDWCRAPLSPQALQQVADALNCRLPTRKLVLDIYRSADLKLPALPWGPPYNEEMVSPYRFLAHHRKIEAQISGRSFTLAAGHKKDVVVSPKLRVIPRRVGIFGWFQANGMPIQGLNTSSHDDLYADYSHGGRLVHEDVLVTIDGAEQSMKYEEVMAHPQLHTLLSDEGPHTFTRYEY